MNVRKITAAGMAIAMAFMAGCSKEDQAKPEALNDAMAAVKADPERAAKSEKAAADFKHQAAQGGYIPLKPLTKDDAQKPKQ